MSEFHFLPPVIAEKSFSLYPKLNFASTNFSHWETKIFEQINRKRVGLNLYHWNSCKCSCYGFPKILNITKIVHLATIAIFTHQSNRSLPLELSVNSLSGRIKKHATEEFYIFSQSFDWLSARKNLRGQKTIGHCFKTICYCTYCSFYCFFENFRGAKVVFGGAPL